MYHAEWQDTFLHDVVICHAMALRPGSSALARPPPLARSRRVPAAQPAEPAAVGPHAPPPLVAAPLIQLVAAGGTSSVGGYHAAQAQPQPPAAALPSAAQPEATGPTQRERRSGRPRRTATTGCDVRHLLLLRLTRHALREPDLVLQGTGPTKRLTAGGLVRIANRQCAMAEAHTVEASAAGRRRAGRPRGAGGRGRAGRYRQRQRLE